MSLDFFQYKLKMLTSLTIYVVPTILLLIGIRKYREFSWGKCKNKVKLNGKVAIVTGANSGIGYEIVKQLASRDAQVILACRSLEKARDAINSIKKNLLNNPILVPMELDLASLKSVKAFADSVKKDYPEIHLLFNNAGVAFPKNKRVETKDGFEVHIGVNHLGHFFLTNLLLDTLIKSHGRIVIITSSLHKVGKLNIDDLNSLKADKKTNLYANSKQANVYFCHELAMRTKDKTVNVYGVCPGWVYTSLFRHSIKWYHYLIIGPVAFFFMRTPRQGSETAIYCATEPSLEKESGLLYRDCKRYNSPTILRDSMSRSLWDESELMINKVMT